MLYVDEKRLSVVYLAKHKHVFCPCELPFLFQLVSPNRSKYLIKFKGMGDDFFSEIPNYSVEAGAGYSEVLQLQEQTILLINYAVIKAIESKRAYSFFHAWKIDAENDSRWNPAHCHQTTLCHGHSHSLMEILRPPNSRVVMCKTF